ncbi:MAG TPA: hypothetical protein VFM18_01360 [Methanosarcina sp.]|nr:hypothetical protein [Methanosarcina sp.]
MNKNILALLLCIVGTKSYCCSMPPPEILKVDQDYVAPFDEKTFRPFPIPTPEVSVIGISRGHNVLPGQSSCGDIGGASLKISFPSDSKHNISDYGFYIRVIEGTAPIDEIGTIPVVLSNVINNSGEYQLSWVESNPKPFEAKVIVFAISKNLKISEPRVFTLKHNGG